jgi:hypothetical protein
MAHDYSTIEELVTSLPAFMSKDDSSKNYDLLWATAQAIDRLDSDMNEVEQATSLTDATQEASIDRIADVVGTARRDGESLDKYRSRVLVEFQGLTAEGTIQNVFTILQNVLGGDPEDLWYQDWRELFDEPSTIAFLISYEAVVDSILDPEDLSELLNRLSPAGKNVEVQYNGSFRPVTVADYEDGNHDPARGFGTLDEYGDPAESGGTFGGLLN